MTRRVRAAVCTLLLLACCPSAPGADAFRAPADATAGARTNDTPPLINISAKRTWKNAGRKLDYMVEARETGVGDNGQGPTGTIFSFSYLRTDAPHPRARPVIFFFNGGPGASTAMLHLSGFGPKRVPPLPHGRWAVDGLEDSPSSLLDTADLVFVDAMGTGYSRILPGGKPEDFYGVDADARTLAEFIEHWLDQQGRWTSPKYLMGESYGSFRAPLVADALTGGISLGHWHGVQIDGVILVGTVLDMTQISANPGNDLPFVLRLPSMAAIAWHYHKAGTGETQASFMQRARDFANDIYLPALNRGDALTDEQKASLAKQLADLMGLSPELVLKHNLRVSTEDFTHALLADQGLILSPYDARDTLPVRNTQGFSSMADPGSAASDSQLSVALNDYIRRDLGIDTPRSYDEVHYDISGQWRWEGRAAGPYWNSTPYLTDLMAQNPRLRVFVIGGCYDLVTPVFAAERSLLHAGLPRDRVELHYYQGGHAAYVGEDNLKQISTDIRTFIEK